MSIFLETKRLILKTPELSDFDHLYALQSDPAVMKYIGQGVRTKEEVAAGLDVAIAHQNKYGFSFGCVFEKVSGAFVGRAGLIHLAYNDNDPDIEVGYALKTSYWSKGYATELAQGLIKWGFRHLAVNKLSAVIKPENESSRHVLEKVNMQYVGLIDYNGIDVAYYEICKNKLDHRKFKLVPATFESYPVMQNMGRFYVYDLSESMGFEEGWEIPTDGLFECIDFKKYWEDEQAHPFFIYFENEIAGFVVVDRKGSHDKVDFNIAQFFILRKFKGKGVGKLIAYQCFDQFKGVWEVMVMPRNENAYRFWRTIIQQYTNRQFKESTKPVAHFNNNVKNIFEFCSRG